MTNAITLEQFEKINDLFNACLRRPDLEKIMAHPQTTDARRAYFRPEWELMDACVDAIGFEASQDFASATDCAATILTNCLTGKMETIDREAA